MQIFDIHFIHRSLATTFECHIGKHLYAICKLTRSNRTNAAPLYDIKLELFEFVASFSFSFIENRFV